MINILTIGDSHSEILKDLGNYDLNKFHITACVVKGATISGIENPRSQTNVFDKFEEALKNNTNCKYCIIHIGEVDTGYVLWYKHEKTNITIDELLRITVERYAKFINKVISYKYLPIILSAPLPTLGDSDDKLGEVANARKSINACQLERTKLTLKLNSEMEMYCKRNNILNINMDKILLGENGLILDKFKNKDKFDHHLESEIYLSHIQKEFKKLIK